MFHPQIHVNINIFKEGSLPIVKLQKEIFANALLPPISMWLKRANKGTLPKIIIEVGKIKNEMLGCKESQLKIEPFPSNRKTVAISRPQKKIEKNKVLSLKF